MKQQATIATVFVAAIVQAQAAKLQATPCENWEANKASFEEAKSKWAQPDCYDYSYTFRGYQVGLPEPTLVQVRNGVAVGENKKTLTDFFDMIETNCISECPTKGAQTCANEYDADNGYPSSVYIRMSQYIADGTMTYGIDDFVVVDCQEAAVQEKGQLDGGEQNIRDSAGTETGEDNEETQADKALETGSKETSSAFDVDGVTDVVVDEVGESHTGGSGSTTGFNTEGSTNVKVETDADTVTDTNRDITDGKQPSTASSTSR